MQSFHIALQERQFSHVLDILIDLHTKKWFEGELLQLEKKIRPASMFPKTDALKNSPT